jgi:hypothetical protein
MEDGVECDIRKLIVEPGKITFADFMERLFFCRLEVTIPQEIMLKRRITTPHL